TFAKQASLPLQYVFADHCFLDIFIVDEETRSIVYRVWLTVLIDAFSRCIIGMALLEEEPCIESIQSGIKHAIWTKENWLKEIGLEFPQGAGWECYGIPHTLSLVVCQE
ncbi:MAG TPA: hypothetical protein VEA58_04220, partial [Anaerovoracaceae bacterium]|nr:hypothetical protein [Anaerovoracaceae bacterium]